MRSLELENFSSKDKEERRKRTPLTEAMMRNEFAKWRAIQKNRERNRRDALFNHMTPFRMETQGLRHLGDKTQFHPIKSFLHVKL